MSGLRLIKAGDWLSLLAALCAVGWLFVDLWASAPGAEVVIRSDGHLVVRQSLARDATVTVQGALGPSVIRILAHRVRVVSDPGPRQICVKEGWLQRVGEAAICLPNHVTVEITGRHRLYDSLNY
ncbi:MAG: NusG domain II-containing protein [Betaproteobacteria bacterium]|nr:NusG domain II-containing protein [Betaproteobacteria bacterium]